MASPYSYYVAGIVYEKDHVLLTRELDGSSFPKSGYHFPGGKGKESDQLLSKLHKKYGFKGKAILSIEPLQHKGIVLTPFVLKETYPLSFDEKKMQHRFVTEEELDRLYIDPIDKLLAKRLFSFKEAYFGQERSEPLLEKGKTVALLQCLSYFKDKGRLPASEMVLFRKQIKNASSFERIKAAFDFLSLLYELDKNEYLEILSLRSGTIPS